ncbi:hypothetical protein NC651_019840 [Populus alba x Populus x berolinensis]|nr:hypothetical protein NC651_019840 [Populus alba x Populus x berolinensis]
MLNSFKIYIYTPSKPFSFSSPTESLFFTSLQASPFVTQNPEEAHLFFVPFASNLSTRSIARFIRDLRMEFPYWNRTLGADHFYVSCAGLGYESDRNLVELKKNSVQISCFPVPDGKFVPHKDITLPPLARITRASHAPGNRTVRYLVRHNGAKDSKLANELRNDSDFLMESEPSNEMTLVERLGSSMFCLFEDGADISGIGEALRFGCVPVMVTDRPMQDLPLMDVLSWQKIAVFVGSGGGVKEVKRVLDRTCKDDECEGTRRLGVAASQHFGWNEIPQPYDSMGFSKGFCSRCLAVHSTSTLQSQSHHLRPQPRLKEKRKHHPLTNSILTQSQNHTNKPTPLLSHSLPLHASKLPYPLPIYIYIRTLFVVELRQSEMAEGDNNGSSKPTVTPYEEALDALSSLITKRSRADKSNNGDRFDVLFDYLKILELEEAISEMKIIHVAGTKGKGSTCTFTESILRNCGFRTGLFTSPHLIDVRERFRLDGKDICEEKFLAYFWWCYDRLKEKSTEDVPMPTYFRFLALLAFKIFSAEQVDVAILEVGLGGKFDATNVVQKPIVCGIASLGYDHMEILGDTLAQIAGEKAGIFKDGIPAFTVPQPDEAMNVLEEKASELNVHLQVAEPLDAKLLNGLKLRLEGEHQYLNAGLAIALSFTWLQRTGHHEFTHIEQASSLPEQFIKGLTTASLQGRAQIVTDQYINAESYGDLVFYLDGAHSPESMEMCARWFSLAIKEDSQKRTFNYPPQNNSESTIELVQEHHDERYGKSSMQILLFNCMSVRDPQLLLPPLMKACASHGVYFKKALFVPSTSVYYKVGSHALPPTDSQVNLSWQFALQRVWENLIQSDKGTRYMHIYFSYQRNIGLIVVFDLAFVF